MQMTRNMSKYFRGLSSVSSREDPGGSPLINNLLILRFFDRAISIIIEK
jgi:hypothetical protein